MNETAAGHDDRDVAEAVTAMLDAYRDAWNAGDADAFGDLFTADATYVIFLGDALLGRDAIRENHRDVFTKWQAGTTLAVRPVSINRLSDTVISVLTVGGIDTDPAAITIDKFQTFTLVRGDSGWKIAAFHNTSMAAWNLDRYNRAD